MEQTMLKQMYNTYKTGADNIKGWENMTKTAIADKYVEYEKENNEFGMNNCFGALMCKYWYMVPYLFSRHKGFKLDIEDFVMFIEDALIAGLHYKHWQNKDYEISKDKDGAEKIFNRCIYSRINRMYGYTNHSVRKINYETFSLDGLKEEMKRHSEHKLTDDDMSFEFEQIDTELAKQNSRDNIKSIFEYFISVDDYVSALIVDLIAYGRCFKDYSEKETFKDIETGEDIEVKTPTIKFEPKKVVTLLNKLRESDIAYYRQNYLLNQAMMKNCLNKVSKIPNEKLYEKIQTTLNTIKNNEELLSMLQRYN